MKLKKLLALVMACVMIMALAACGANGANETAAGTKPAGDKPAPADNEEVVLSVSIWDSVQEPGIKEILDDFTEATGIKTKVSVVKWSEYWTMLEAGAQGGSLPDVFWMHSNESERYMSNGMLLDLTDRIAASEKIQVENYPSEIWNLYTHDSKYYAVPKDIDTIALWYNKAMFDEAGLAYPTADWTWEDMGEAARKLTKPDGSQYGLAMNISDGQSTWFNMVYDNGGYIISEDKKTSGLDDPKTIEALEMFKSWCDEGLMPSLEIMAENSDSVLFESGKVAMITQGSWMINEYKANEYTSKNCDIVELPKNATTGRRASIYNGLGWAASANCEHPDEAWALIEYLGSKEAQQKQAELGVTMSAYKGTSEAWINSSDFNLQAYMNMMDDLVIKPWSRNSLVWEQDMNEMLKQIYNPETNVAELCKEMAAKMNATLAEE